ncbi:MAG: class I SAM-dependent methyltransferase [Pseudomonadota bacterium]
MRQENTLDVMIEPRLSKENIRDHYNKLGDKQNRQHLYEIPAFNAILQNGQFETAGHVIELGCGTGRLALQLFKEKLPDEAHYIGLDISEAMIELARKNLKPFSPRIKLSEKDASEALPLENEAVDRCVISYMFDTFQKNDIENTLIEAHRILKKDGLLCLSSLAPISSGVSGIISKLWAKIYNFNPKLVGGCQPVDLAALLNEDFWSIEHKEHVTAYGIASDVIVAKRL